MQEMGMIWPGARIGVAVSGGVDSWVLLQVLLLRKRTLPFDFEVMALHVNPGFDPESHEPLLAWCFEHNVAVKSIVDDHGLRAHSSENRKNSPCFFCAWHRRKVLFNFCLEQKLTHLAFGHNLEDLVENFFMNLVQSGRVSGMKSKEIYFRGNLQLIRPLIRVEKKYIRSAAAQWGFPFWSNVCPSSTSSGRADMSERIKAFLQGDRRQRTNTLNGILRWQLDLDRRLG